MSCRAISIPICWRRAAHCQTTRLPIDYILLGYALRNSLIAGSFERLTYSANDAWRPKLADHCPVAIKLSLD